MVRVILSLLVVLLAWGSAGGQVAKAGDSGTAIGIVREVTGEWILLAPSNGGGAGGVGGVKYWFGWAATRDAVHDADLDAAVRGVHVGDKVLAHWRFDDRERLESVVVISAAAVPSAANSVPAPMSAGPSTAPAVASTAPAAAEKTESLPSGSTAAEQMNGMIDNLVATGERLLELPVFMLLGGMAAAGGLMLWGITRIRRPGVVKFLKGALAVLVLLVCAFMLDRKIARLQETVDDLRARNSADAMARIENTAKKGSGDGHRQGFLFDADAAHRALAAQFGDVTLRPLIYDDASDVVQVHLSNPLAQAYLAIVDLKHPGIEIKLGASMENKTLTTAFARENDCTIAINGEAGQSPAPGSGFGEWRGYMVRQGEVFMREDPTIVRPYLSFDRQSQAAFTPMSQADRTLAAGSYNVIWGRWDSLIKGVVQGRDPGNRQPRTAMGISQDGSKLYLFVVDGRQPRYSNGFTHEEVGRFLKAFGAYDGMLCDEGGSSCMYLKSFGGICNIPSDNQGVERPTYTHFGIVLHSAAGAN